MDQDPANVPDDFERETPENADGEAPCAEAECEDNLDEEQGCKDSDVKRVTCKRRNIGKVGLSERAEWADSCVAL
jgi:hypothetical protein